ncbi:hypothetical protein [Jeotgalibacillus marinus]|uniref:Small, acid-soluble spore protein Tlp n=1 Tax=Jeotgalibacillus marinus TaxID=86667 RepID=A0ABV3Q6A7_9BACL
MTDKVNCNKAEHRTKIKKMEAMVNNTLANVYDAEISMEHDDSAAHREKIKEKNAQRLESVEDTRREIEEERSYL